MHEGQIPNINLLLGIGGYQVSSQVDNVKTSKPQNVVGLSSSVIALRQTQDTPILDNNTSRSNEDDLNQKPIL